MKAITTVYRKELKRNRRSFIAWTLVICALVFLYTAFYPSVSAASDQMEDLLEIYPEGFLRAFDIRGIENLTDILGFYVTYNGMFILVLGSIFSTVVAASIVSKEEREKTAEFLLAQPASRQEVWGGKILAYLTYLIGLNVAVGMFGALSIGLFSDATYDVGTFVAFSTYAFLAMAACGAIGLALSVAFKRARGMTGAAVGTVLGAYFIDMLSRIADSANAIGYISVFKFVRTDVLAADYGLDLPRVAYFTGVVLLFFVLSLVRFSRRDISL